MKKFLLSTLALLLTTFSLFAQVTTSGITGSVSDEKGESLAGATIVAIHNPSGTRYAASANADGRYNIPGMRVGGPYTVTIKFLSFQDRVFENITLALGTTANISAKLKAGSTELREVQVTGIGKNSPLNSERTGASTTVSGATIASIPTINRGLRDFTKLSPLANINGSGTSFAGTSNRYNQFAIDGITNNDVFGLSTSGTNGGQLAGLEPISLDAIEEFQINIAPYDVRQGGFTGGGINAVTRSGTNKYTGSVYYFGNNQSMVSKYNPNTEVKADYPKYKDYQTGFRVGGPIIKDKLFFFLNGEITRSTTPLAFDPTDSGSGSTIALTDLNRVLATLKRIAPNYDPGSFGAIDDVLNSEKVLGKIDWNISQKHRLSLRHSYTYGENIDNSRGNNFLNLYNNGQYFPSTTNSSALELNSIFSDKFSNNLLIGYTTVRDDRDPLGDPFPNVRVYLTGGANIQFGSEFSSVANKLDQDILSVTDNFNYYKGKHTFTVGTNNEFYKFYNQFVQNIYGAYGYKTLADFESIGTASEVRPAYYSKSYSFDTSDDPSQSNGAAKFSAMQLGLYVQDAYKLNDRIQLTAGLRADLPVFNDNAPRNDAFATAYSSRGISTDQKPKTQLLWSPRFGFNWDVLGDNSLKVRGGTGLFTGRVPFVWISNQYTNSGTVLGTYTLGTLSSSANPVTTPAALKFSADPYNQPIASTFGGSAAVGAINITDKNYKFPQTFRTNIGIDKTLPYGLIATVEGIYSKGYNNIIFENLNRDIDPAFTFAGPDKRPRYYTGRRNASFDEIILFSNSDEGYTYNFVAQLQKPLQRTWGGSISYTFGRAQDIFPATSSTAYSNWRNLYNVNGPNAPEAGIANFDTKHRVSGYITYKKEYLKNFATQISLFYNGQSGQPVSYIYNGDFNNDGTSNDLIYVPKDFTESNLVDVTGSAAKTAAQQWAELDAFIEGDEYLKTRRGKYVERNGGRLPFQHQIDIRLLQDLGIAVGKTSNKLQISVDLLNVGNLINKKWGADYATSFNSFSLINYTGLGTGALSTTPKLTYTGAGQTNGKVYTESNFNSRWRGQIGLRYIFN